MFRTEYAHSPIQIPQDLEFHMFPRLEKFAHTFCMYRSGTLRLPPVLIKLLPPARTANGVCNLKILSLTILWTGSATGSADPIDYPWVPKLNAAATNPFWADFDNVLANRHHFPALRKVSISLKFRLIATRAINTDAPQKEAHSTLSNMFSASIEASIPLEIMVNIDQT